MPRLLIINDIHFASYERYPSSRKSSYLDEISEKINDCRTIAANNYCDYTIITGDIFHYPRSNAITHSLVSKVISLLKNWPTPIYAIAGNHDLSEAGYRAVDKQPVYVLQESGCLLLLHQQGLWLNDNETYVLFYSYDDNNLDKYKQKRPANCRNFVLVCHDMLMPSGNFPFGFISHEEAAATSDYNAVIYGHVHWDMGVSISRQTKFISAGSLSRVARTEENIKRKIRVAIADISNGQIGIEFHILPSQKPAEEIFVVPAQTKMDNPDFAQYVKSLSEKQIQGVDLRSYILQMNLDEDIANKIAFYLFDEINLNG